MRYIRFETEDFSSRLKACTGIFKAAYALQRSESLDLWSSKLLGDVLNWFSGCMHVPKLHQSFWGALFWFRDDNQMFIEQAWALTLLLQDNGITVNTIESSDPGTICYQDSYQIAAIPRRVKRSGRRRGFGWDDLSSAHEPGLL